MKPGGSLGLTLFSYKAGKPTNSRVHRWVDLEVLQELSCQWKLLFF